MSVSFTCWLDVNEDNVPEHNVSSAMQSFRIQRSMDMVGRVQTVGRLDAVFESYDDEFLQLFKHGRLIAVRSFPSSGVSTVNDPYIYTGYVRSVRRLPAGKFSVGADFALAWLHNDDDTATYVNFRTNKVIQDVLSHASVSAPWHQVAINPQGLVPGTYQFGVLGDSVLSASTLLGAYWPPGQFERDYQQLGRVDAIVLDIDSHDKSGSLFSIISKAVLSEAGFLFVQASNRFLGGINFRGRYGRTSYREPGYSYTLTSWNGADYAAWNTRVTELTALSPNRNAQSGAVYKVLRNFHVPAGGSFFQFEEYIGEFPIEITGNVRIEGLPDGVQCFPTFAGFHLYLQFDNTSRALVVIDELTIYADVVKVESVSRRQARTDSRGGRQILLEFAHLAGYEDVLLDHYIDQLNVQNKLSAIYLQGAALAQARYYELVDILDLSRGKINEAAYVQSMEWSYQNGVARLRIGLWPFVDLKYALVGKDGYDEVGEVVVGI